MLRKSRMFKPAVPIKRPELAIEYVLPSAGKLFSASPMFTAPVLISCSPLITVTGAGAIAPSRKIREPVTSTRSIFVACSSCASTELLAVAAAVINAHLMLVESKL